MVRRMTEKPGSPPLSVGGTPRHIVLASTSSTRRQMLEASGVPFVAEDPRIDEAACKESLRAEGATPVETAEMLAQTKAASVTARFPDLLVLGADQVLQFGNEVYDKPRNREEALMQLRALRGHRHKLISYAVILGGGQRLWHAVDEAKLEVRRASEDFLEAYLDAVGEDAFKGPGGYRVEALGSQLFSGIEGSHFTILGLPLLPLLDFLRVQRILMS